MSRAALIVLMLTLTAPGSMLAQEVSPSQAARAAFAEGKKLVEGGIDGRPAFQRALLAFGEQAKSRPVGVMEMQSLGNAAFLADDLPRAILAYRYGLFCDRHHVVLRENLAYARSQVRRLGGTSQRGWPEPDPWPYWLPRFGATGCLSIAALAYGLACLALTLAFVQRKARPMVFAVILGLTACSAGYGCYLLRWQRDRDLEQPPMVIQNDDVPLRIGNGLSYPRHADLPTLTRGMEARRLHARGSWVQLQFASGEVGWVPASEVLTWNDLSFRS